MKGVLKKAWRMLMSLVGNPVPSFHLPTIEELYENPVTTITITPKWWDVEDDVLSFIEQLCSGYLWEVKYGTAFIAQHDERREVENLLRTIHSLKHQDKEGRWVPNHDEEIALLLVDFARLVPRMWD